MGAFHAGHHALMRAARERCDTVVVSLFVNPAQFDEAADLAAYPRDEERDAAQAAELGVDVLYAPPVEEVYPPGFATAVRVEGLSDVLEGAARGPVPDRDGDVRFARALPLERAVHPHTLLAYEAAGEPLPVRRGGPLRAIVPGWYATDSVKWLDRIIVTDEPYDGYFEAVDYRIADLGSDGPGDRKSGV